MGNNILLILIFLISSFLSNGQLQGQPEIKYFDEAPGMEPRKFEHYEQQPREDPFSKRENQKFKKKAINEIDYETLERIQVEFKFVFVAFMENIDSKIINICKRVAERIRPHNKDIIFTYIEAYQDQLEFQRYNLKKGQTFILLDKTKKIYYDELLEEETFYNWILNTTNRNIMTINSRKDFEKFTSQNQRAKVLAIYDKSMKKEIKLIEEMVKKDIFADYGQFVVGMAHDQSIIPYPDDVEMPSLILYRDADDDLFAIKYKGNLTDGNDIIEFCNLNSIKLIEQYSEDIAFRIFAGSVSSQLLIFTDPSQNNSQLLQELKTAAQYNRDNDLKFHRVLFVEVPFNKQNQDMLEFFDIQNKKQLPKIFISQIDNRVQKMNKYEYNKDEINSDFVKDFIEDYWGRKLSLYYKSEEFPENQEELKIKKLVGNNFEKEVIRSRSTQVVFFCSEKLEAQKECQAPFRQYEYIINKKINSEKLQNVSFYTYDALMNESPHLEFNELPQLRIYIKGEKKKPRFFRQEFTLNNLAKYFNTYFPDFDIKISKQENEKFVDSLLSPEDREGIKKARENYQKYQQEELQQDKKEQQQQNINSEKQNAQKKEDL